MPDQYASFLCYVGALVREEIKGKPNKRQKVQNEWKESRKSTRSRRSRRERERKRTQTLSHIDGCSLLWLCGFYKCIFEKKSLGLLGFRQIDRSVHHKLLCMIILPWFETYCVCLCLCFCSVVYYHFPLSLFLFILLASDSLNMFVCLWTISWQFLDADLLHFRHFRHKPYVCCMAALLFDICLFLPHISFSFLLFISFNEKKKKKQQQAVVGLHTVRFFLCLCIPIKFSKFFYTLTFCTLISTEIKRNAKMKIQQQTNCSSDLKRKRSNTKQIKCKTKRIETKCSKTKMWMQ